MIDSSTLENSRKNCTIYYTVVKMKIAWGIGEEVN